MSHESNVLLTKNAIVQRGLFMHRYSGIEFGITELIVRAQLHPAYHALGKLPFPFPKRIERVKAMLECEGPIREYEKGLRAMLTDFLNWEEARHFLVHGIMVVDHEKPEGGELTFSMYDHVDGNVSYGTFVISYDTLRAEVVELQKISSTFPALVSAICEEARFPPLMLDPRFRRAFKRPKL